VAEEAVTPSELVVEVTDDVVGAVPLVEPDIPDAEPDAGSLLGMVLGALAAGSLTAPPGAVLVELSWA
jgi:hypothetical protein